MQTCRGVIPLASPPPAQPCDWCVMADRSKDLEFRRDAFLTELAESQPDLSGYQEFLRYWKSVESEAMHTEDLGELDSWVRDLARDKERVAALKSRTDTMTGEHASGAIAAMVQILKLVLEILDAIERRLRRLRDERMSALASMLWKGGPGTTAKPKPDEKDKKDGKKGGEAAEGPKVDPAVLAQQQKPPELKRDKKMER